MPRAGVRGELRAYFLAAEFVKVCRLLAGDETSGARLYYKQVMSENTVLNCVVTEMYSCYPGSQGGGIALLYRPCSKERFWISESLLMLKDAETKTS